MKQKIVIKVQMSTEKCRTKALQIVAGTKGMISLKIDGAQREKLVVTGDDIDITELSAVLRKKVGFTTIISVQEFHQRGTTTTPSSSYELANFNPSYAYANAMALVPSNYHPRTIYEQQYPSSPKHY